MSQDPLIGRKLGAYLVQAKLGEGGMASVYKASHDRLRRDVAIKVISAQIADQADFRLRFEREAQLIASLEHRNIVTVYDFGEQDDLTYLAMQFVGGGTLRERLQAGRPFDLRMAAQYTLQMARALHHAHQRGIVHRDVKPQNMLVSSSDANHLLLSDFGIAKLFDAFEDTHTNTPISFNTVPSDPALTSADQMIGTADYMAPEQINRQAVDARTDVYALGVVLYQMLTGYTPFQATTVIGLLYQHVNTPPRPVRDLNPYAPDILARITAHALEKAPAARFQSAEEMAQALEQALNLSTHPLTASLNSFSGLSLPPQTASTPYGNINTYPPQGAPTPHTTNTPPAYDATYISKNMPGTTSTANDVTYISKNTPLPMTSAPGASGAAPGTRKKARSPFNIWTIVTTLLLVLALVLFGRRALPALLHQSPGGSQASIAISKVDTFDERFADNKLGWLNGTDPTGHLQATLQNNTYTLAVDTIGATFFPYPQNVNPLPVSFTLTAHITQTQGAADRYYGLTFYFKTDNSQSTTAYAFVITSSGKYALLKYGRGADPVNLGPYGTSTSIAGLGKENTLTVAVANGRITCSVNGSVVGAAIPVPIEPLFRGGSMSLFVTGPNTTIVVSEVRLAR